MTPQIKKASDSLKERLLDEEFREEWDRFELARAIALELVTYRADHNLSQTALARQLKMQQPAIARLESGDHNPSVETLMRIARGLGIDLHIDITPDHLGVKLTA